MRRLAHWYLTRRGWSFHGALPHSESFVLIGAPHTSNWDFVLFLGLMHHFGIRAKALGKRVLVRWPYGRLMRRWIVPVDRSQGAGLVAQAVAAFDAEPTTILAIAPEGTRGGTTHWKSGFYRIAAGAGVPVVVAAVDGVGRRVVIAGSIRPGDDVRSDMDEIRGMLAGVTGWADRSPIVPRLAEEDTTDL